MFITEQYILLEGERSMLMLKKHLGIQHSNHAFLAQLLHAGKEMGGLQNLPPLMKEVGFSQIDIGGTKFQSLGYVRGRVSAGRVEQ